MPTRSTEALKSRLGVVASPVVAKLAAAAILVLLLLIPKSMVTGVISEREERRNEARKEVSDKWGGAQTVAGPVLAVPYRTEDRDAKGNVKTQDHLGFFLPERLEYEATVVPQVRYRGIFEVILYRSSLSIRGEFGRPSFAEFQRPPDSVEWDRAFLLVGLSDARGIQNGAVLEWNGRALVLNPGVPVKEPIGSGVHARTVLGGADRFTFRFTASINGSEDLSFLPLGRLTRVSVGSTWRTPSFQGSFLPRDRSISSRGFSARWEIPHLARNYPQHWSDQEEEADALAKSAFGVTLLYPVDSYQTTTRSAKYGVLFIALTFLIFFMFEILGGLRVHPVQYLLVGFGLLIFYVLLLSLSEHLWFGAAYLAASAAIVGLVTAYSSAVLSTWKRARVIGILLGFLYAYLYVLLKAEDYALLLGSLGLFAALATVMYLTRRVDWYAAGAPGRR